MSVFLEAVLLQSSLKRTTFLCWFSFVFYHIALLHLVKRYSCFCKILLQMHKFLALARLFCKSQIFLTNATFSFSSASQFQQEKKRKKMLHLQEKSCVCKIIMPKQEICAFATKSCKSKNIFPLNVKVHCEGKQETTGREWAKKSFSFI